MLENKFKQGLTKELKERFPGCVVVHLDPNEVQGHPDLLVLYGSTWAALEGKRSANAPHRPNQDYYVRQMNEMSFAAFIYPGEQGGSSQCNGTIIPGSWGSTPFWVQSKYHWLNYDTQRLVDAFMSCQAKEKGTRLHAFAAECINLKQKAPEEQENPQRICQRCNWFPHGPRAGFVLQRKLFWYYRCHCI